MTTKQEKTKPLKIGLYMILIIWVYIFGLSNGVGVFNGIRNQLLARSYEVGCKLGAAKYTKFDLNKANEIDVLCKKAASVYFSVLEGDRE